MFQLDSGFILPDEMLNLSTWPSWLRWCVTPVAAVAGLWIGLLLTAYYQRAMHMLSPVGPPMWFALAVAFGVGSWLSIAWAERCAPTHRATVGHVVGTLLTAWYAIAFFGSLNAGGWLAALGSIGGAAGAILRGFALTPRGRTDEATLAAELEHRH